MNRRATIVRWSMVVLVLVALAAIVGPAALPDDHRTVIARFDTAAGLYVGNPVDVLGMHVGTIKKVQNKDTFAEVTMSIDPDVQIPATASAVVVSDSVMTERHIEFTPAYRGGAVMADGAVLDLDRTKTPVQFESLLNVASKLSKSLEGDGKGNGPISQFVDVGAASTSGNGAGLRQALDALSDALRMGDDHGEATHDAITTIVKNLDSLTQAAATNDQTIRGFGTGVRQLTELLDEQEIGTGDTGSKLVDTMAATTDLLQKYGPKITSMLGSADVTLKSVADNRNGIGTFFDDFPLAVDNAYNAVDPVARAGRAHVNIDRILLGGQTLKEVCNVLNLKQLGCNTGSPADMSPDFGITSMLAGLAGVAGK